MITLCHASILLGSILPDYLVDPEMPPFQKFLKPIWMNLEALMPSSRQEKHHYHDYYPPESTIRQYNK